MTAFVRRFLFVGIALAMMLSVIPAQSAFARSSTELDQSSQATSEGDSDVTTESTRDKTGEPAKRLSAAKLRVCERRATVIKNSMTRSRERADRHIKLFTAIADRTKAFYVKKGNTLANYDELVAAVDTAKAKAEAGLSVTPTATEFDCNGTDPKGMGMAFRAALKQEVEDLKAYKTAVKDLVVGVKSVQAKETN
jgi:hypothetical protein